MIVRPAAKTDADALASMRSASWRAAYEQILPRSVLKATVDDPNMARSYADAIAQASADGRAFFVADDGTVAGYSCAGAARERDVDPTVTGELYALYTHPDHWGTSAGRALQQSALSFLVRSGYEDAIVRVFSANGRARRFYAKTGWTFEGDEQVSRRWLIPEVRYRRTLPRVRAPEATDARAMAEVHVRAWQDAYAGQMPDSYLAELGEQVDRRAAGWERTIAEPGEGGVLVVESENRVTGIAMVGPSRDDDAPASTGELLMINLVSEAWGTGAGQALFDSAVDLLARRGFEQATLWVLDTNARARRFYERNGWTPDGATRDDDLRGFTLHEVRYRTALAVID